MIENKRNNSIDFFRYLCAIMVVAIHTHPFADISEYLEVICSEIIPSMAVPFFFAVSGYYFWNGLEKKQNYFNKYLKRILKLYFTWSCIYWVIDFFRWGYDKPIMFIRDCLYGFFITGSHYHFWYFVSLIYVICIITILYKLNINKNIVITISMIFYIIGCSGSLYSEKMVDVPILKYLFVSEKIDFVRKIIFIAFPFFVLGILLNTIEKNSSIANRKTTYIFCMAIVLWIIENVIIRVKNYQESTSYTLGLYLIILVLIIKLISNPLPQYVCLAQKSRIISEIIFCSHPLFIMIIKYINKCLNGKIIMSNTIIFVLTIILSHLLGYIFFRIKTHRINKH